MLQTLRHVGMPAPDQAVLEAAAAWLHERISTQLSVHRVAEVAPQLLALRPDQLDQTLRFAQRLESNGGSSGNGGNGSGSRVESMQRLLQDVGQLQ